MGQSVARLSHLGVITSDNPRSEDPLTIMEAVREGMKEGGAKPWSGKGELPAAHAYVMIPDRKEAIFSAVRWSRPGDLLLIAGKGHETYQLLGGKTLSFDDRLVAREALMACFARKEDL
jgi:UDP-N-acetylmuramyl tripeptide synthase